MMMTMINFASLEFLFSGLERRILVMDNDNHAVQAKYSQCNGWMIFNKLSMLKVNMNDYIGHK